MSEALQLALIAVLQQVLPVIIVGIIGYVGQSLVAYIEVLRERKVLQISDESISFLKRLTIEAVNAAEKAGIIGELRNVALEKKAFAVEFVRREAAEAGLTTLSENSALIADLIEASINQGLHKVSTGWESYPISDLPSIQGVAHVHEVAVAPV